MIDDEDVLTMPVKPNGVLRLWCGAVSTPPPKISWSLEGAGELKAYANEHMLMVSPFTPDDEVCLRFFFHPGLVRTIKYIS